MFEGLHSVEVLRQFEVKPFLACGHDVGVKLGLTLATAVSSLTEPPLDGL